MSRVVLQLKPIKPAPLKVGGIRLELLNELRHQGVEHRKLLRRTVQTWRGAKPDFKTEVSLAGGDAVATTRPEGSEEGVSKWHFLDQGTRVRWALMSPGWRSKTRPGRFSSSGGAGRVLFFGRKAFRRRGMRPRRGIEARRWTETVEKQRAKPFERAMNQAVIRGADHAYD